MENTKKELTTDEAISIIGQALAHDSLKLSQREHLLLIDAYNKIFDTLKPKEDDKSGNQKPTK